MVQILDEFYELPTVLHWGPPTGETEQKLQLKELIHKQLLTPSQSGQGYTLFIGTRKYGDCTRQLLLDSSTMLRIRSYLLSLPSLIITSAPQPLFQLQPLSLQEYINVGMVEIKSRKKLEAKVWNLNGSNKRRAGKAAKRDSVLESARKEAKGEGEGAVVAIAVVAYEKGKRRKKVLEIGWATWTKGAPTSEIKVEHIKIEEYLHIHNGDFVPDRRDAFAFGTSKTLPFEEACDLLYDEIESTPTRPVTLVGNATYLPVSALNLAELQPPPFDLGVLFRSARKDQGVASTLRDMVQWYGVGYEEERLFNAGNNAKYILDTFLQLGRRE
ncbi:hypothetical protein BCR35DRAFT_327986 [Leucosporidium creatinivorum]|uniref:Gfd2/YDR514C-like C-terminal domain-containing protein n=1 Tax=Leucosporidium creatinivorum TaxID=106004 RepID=A0A1Y2G8M9_9BASI|nr:hypothetical protein BCR35DRAFT_327986 [Leucosporidium creatinivorum]